MGPVENKIRKRRPSVGLKAGRQLIGNTIGLCEKINGLRVRQAPVEGYGPRTERCSC